jgi:hypothetical protein
MKITKQRLKEIIREELTAEGSREDMMMPAISMADMEAAMAADDAGLGDLQSDEKFTGGSPEERLLTLIKARELLAAMGKEELTALSKSLDAEQVAVLRHILANPMYAPMEEGWGQGDRAYQQATQLLGQFAQMHGLRNQVADALRQRRVSPQQVQKAVQGASSSYHVAQRLGLG